MDISMKSLVCFKKVAELEHITQAARELYISQAQLSRVVSELEARLGAKLFDRAGKGLRLNESGRAFYEYTCQVIDLTDSAERRVREIYRHERACLTLVSNCGEMLAGALALLRERMPALEYRVLTGEYGKCAALLEEGAADYALCCPMPDNPAFHSVLLRKEPLVVIFPPGHPLEGRERVSLRDLEGETLLAAAPGCAVRETCDRAFEKYRFDPLYRVETAESLLLPRLVEAGLGLAFGPRSQYERDPVFQNRHAELSEPVYGSVGLSWRRDREPRAEDGELVELLRTYYVSL